MFWLINTSMCIRDFGSLSFSRQSLLLVLIWSLTRTSMSAVASVACHLEIPRLLEHYLKITAVTDVWGTVSSCFPLYQWTKYGSGDKKGFRVLGQGWDRVWKRSQSSESEPRVKVHETAKGGGKVWVLVVEVSSFLRANQAGIISVCSGMKHVPAAHLRQPLAIVHSWPRVFMYL